MEDSGVLVGYRPTWRQAAARGAYLGGVVAVVVALTVGFRLSRGVATRLDLALGLLPLLVGVVGAVYGRKASLVADDVGLHQQPAEPRSAAPWQWITDLRPERRGASTRVVVYLESGAVWRLLVPYDGPLLARDPAFEQKLFMLRNLWETHRTWDPYA